MSSSSTEMSSSSLIEQEPLLRTYPDGLSIFPIRDKEIWNLYKKAESCFWTAEELRFKDDIEDWQLKLTDSERETIKYVLCFFAGADSLVNENLVTNFYRQSSLPEVRCFYGFQIAMENIHGEAYSQMIDTFIQDTTEKEKLQNVLLHNEKPSIRNMYEWSMKWTEQSTHSMTEQEKIHTFALQLVANACVEGLMFSPLFVIPFWCKDNGLLNGFSHSNELINRDEGLHFMFASTLFHKIIHKPPEEKVRQVIQEATDCSIALAREAMDETENRGLRGLTVDQMVDYVKFMQDVMLMLFGYEKKHHFKSCPISFMERISMSGKTNFFERNVSEYNMAGFEQMDSDGNDPCVDTLDIVDDF